MSSSSLDECMLWVLTCRTQCRGSVHFSTEHFNLTYMRLCHVVARKEKFLDVKVHQRESEFSLCWSPHSSTTLLTFICGLHFETCSVRNRKGDVICREAGGDFSASPSDAKSHLTSSTVFLLFVSLRVSSTKLSQRPLQSSGSSVTAAVLMFQALMLEQTYKTYIHTYKTTFGPGSTGRLLPLMRSVIWACTGPFSRFPTTMLAILVR